VSNSYLTNAVSPRSLHDRYVFIHHFLPCTILKDSRSPLIKHVWVELRIDSALSPDHETFLFTAGTLLFRELPTVTPTTVRPAKRGGCGQHRIEIERDRELIGDSQCRNNTNVFLHSHLAVAWTANKNFPELILHQPWQGTCSTL
jgi:hypothetical protein